MLLELYVVHTLSILVSSNSILIHNTTFFSYLLLLLAIILDTTEGQQLDWS